jgi:hypothetical protein
LQGHASVHLHAYCFAPFTVTSETSAHGGVLENSPVGADAHAGSTAESRPASGVVVGAVHSGGFVQLLNEQPFVPPTLDVSHPAASPAALHVASVQLVPEQEQLASLTFASSPHAGITNQASAMKAHDHIALMESQDTAFAPDGGQSCKCCGRARPQPAALDAL